MKIETPSTNRIELPLVGRPIDNTALKAYMACPREYFLSMVEHRRPQSKSAALAFGSVWHTILEWHYKGASYERVRKNAIKAWVGHDAEASGSDYRTLDRALLDYDSYLKEFGTAEEEANFGKGRTLGSEEQKFVELTTNAMGGGLIHPYAVKIDRIIELNGLYYIEDHKTTSRFDKNYWKQYDLNQQMMGYVFVANLILPSVKIIGARINLSHVLTKKSTFKRQLFTYTPAQLEEWKDNTNYWMKRVSESHLIARLQDGGDIPEEYEDMPAYMADWLKDKIAWPAHFGDDGCTRRYGLCSYHRVCSTSPRLRERVLENEFDINPWNPMEIENED